MAASPAPFVFGTLIVSCMMTPTIMLKLGAFAAICFVSCAVVFAFICERILWPLLQSTAAPTGLKKTSKEKRAARAGDGPGHGGVQTGLTAPDSPNDPSIAGDGWASFIAKKLGTTPEHMKKLEELERQRQYSDSAATRVQMLGLGDYHRHGLLRQKGRAGQVPGDEWNDESPRHEGREGSKRGAGGGDGAKHKPGGVGLERAEKRRLGAKPALAKTKTAAMRLVVDDFEVGICNHHTPRPDPPGWDTRLAASPLVFPS